MSILQTRPRAVAGASAGEGMNLSDLRRLCIRRQLRVTFEISDGVSCCINEHGATVIGDTAGWLAATEEFERATLFRVMEAGSSTSQTLDRSGLQGLSEGRAPGAKEAKVSG